MDDKKRAQMAKRDTELSHKSKDQLWEIRTRCHKVTCRDSHYLKIWLIGDIMNLEF